METNNSYRIHIHLQALRPYWVLFSFQFWIVIPKGKFCMVKTFWLNIKMTNSKGFVDWLFNLIFIKVNVKKNHSSFIELITCTTTSSTNLMYLKIFCSRIWDAKKVLQNLVSRLISNDFCIVNLTLFFTVRANKKLCKLKVVVANNL